MCRATKLDTMIMLVSQELLAHYKRQDKVVFRCSHCKTVSDDAQQQLTVCCWPKVLMMQISRFGTNEDIPIGLRATALYKVRLSSAGFAVAFEQHASLVVHTTFKTSQSAAHPEGLGCSTVRSAQLCRVCCKGAASVHHFGLLAHMCSPIQRLT